MSDLKINCPICNQEFPAYDQRGFRNGGFTSHHKICLERHQKSNEPQQRDQHTSRASRFALAIRRRVLPARPTSSANLVLEGQNRVTPQSPLSGSSSSSSSSSSSLSQRTEITPAIAPIVPSQVSRPKRHFHPQQRHTWNHWGPRRRSRRSALDIGSNTTTTTSSIIASTAPTATLSNPHTTRSHRSLPAIHSNTESSAFPLLTAITIMDSTTALIIPQTTSPQLSNQIPATSPVISGGGSPFSFTSMLTTLPVESIPLQPSATISTCSSNSNSVNNTFDVHAQRPTHASMDSIPTDWIDGQYYFTTTDDGPLHHQQQQHDHHYHPLHAPVNTNSTPHHPITTGDAYYYHDNTTSIFPAATAISSSTPDLLPIPLRSPENLDGNHDDEPVYYCGYCQPRNGQHDPSCSLMRFIMMDIIGGNDDPSFSSR